MVGLLSWLNSSLYDGLPYAIITLSFVVTFKYIRFPDVTCAGTFVLGGAVAAHIVVTYSLPPYIGLALALLAGAAGGALTGLFHSVLRIERLLAGILSAFCLYAINLLLLHPTLPYGIADTVLTPFEKLDRAVSWENLAWHPYAIAYFLGAIILIKVVLDRFLASEAGLIMRALEDEEAGEGYLRRQGLSPKTYKVLGLIIGNGLVGLSGALVSMKESAANAHRGFDVLITGLIAYLVGVQLQQWIVAVGRKASEASNSIRGLSFLRKFKPTTAATLGAVVYFSLIAFAQRIDVAPEVTKLILAFYIVLTVGDFTEIRQGLSRLRMRIGQSKMEEPDGEQPVIASLKDIRYRYPAAETEILRGINFDVHRGELVLMKGGNGSGKSTLLKLVTGLLHTPNDGSLFLRGKNLTYDPGSRLKTVGYVDQNLTQGVVGTLTVEENLALCHVGATPSFLSKALSRKRKQHIHTLFSSTGFAPDFLQSAVYNLSGGQRQVVNILSLLARKELPTLVLLDEPMNNLDTVNLKKCLAIIEQVHSSGVTVILVSHGSVNGLPIDRVLDLEQLNQSVTMSPDKL